MKLKSFFIILAAALFCREARADFYFEQNVHATEKSLSGVQSRVRSSDFKRKIYVLGQVFSIQIEENGRLKKEYGFDFSKNTYYEADPAAGVYKLFDLTLLAAAFEEMQQGARSLRPSRRGAAAELTRAMIEGKLDYSVRIQKLFFGKKQFAGHEAQLYKLRAGPGSVFLNFFGWYRKADLWASRDVPGFFEYASIRAKLAKNAGFYKIKHNRVSDLITTLSVFEPLPLSIDSAAKRRFEYTESLETTQEMTSAVSTAKIQKEKLLYFKKNARFSWNVVFSKGTEFGSEVSLAHGENFSWRRLLPWFIIPVFFLIFTFLWFLGDSAEKNSLSLEKMLVLRTYILSAVLFVLQVVHYLGELPYWISAPVELGLAAIVGAFFVIWRGNAHWRSVEKQMREANLRYCPHCRARCEQFYVVCPKCNRAIIPAQTHESKFQT